MPCLTVCRMGVALAFILAVSACVAVPYDDGPPGPAPGYYGAYPAAYPWAVGTTVDLGYGYGHGGYYGHGNYGRGGYGRGGYGHGFNGGHGGFGGGHGGGFRH